MLRESTLAGYKQWIEEDGPIRTQFVTVAGVRRSEDLLFVDFYVVGFDDLQDAYRHTWFLNRFPGGPKSSLDIQYAGGGIAPELMWVSSHPPSPPNTMVQYPRFPMQHLVQRNGQTVFIATTYVVGDGNWPAGEYGIWLLPDSDSPENILIDHRRGTFTVD